MLLLLPVMMMLVLLLLPLFVCVFVVNVNDDTDDACFDVDGMPNALDIVAYDDMDDANADARMLNASRRLVGAYASADDANVVEVA